MNIDFHAHVKLTKKSDFSPDYFSETVNEARASGLHAIAMTEHFNTRRYFDIYEFLDSRYPYRDHCYNIDGFLLFPGMEVDVKTGGHILIIGAKHVIFSLREKLEPHTAPDRFPELEQLLDWCEGYREELLIIGAHPFRASNHLTHHHRDTLARLDAFDLNAKDLHTYGPAMREQVEELSRQIGIPVVAGSDTHHPLQFGSVYNELLHGQTECTTIQHLTELIKKEHYQIMVSPCLETKVKSASLVKKLMKQLAAQA